MERSYDSLLAYKKAFALAMDIFEISKAFPKVEIYALTDQIRRSSRSVAACIAEAYRKRTYPPYFVNKISDADMENSETRVWLDFARACQYIDEKEWNDLTEQVKEIGKLINHMIAHPEKYTTPRKTKTFQ